MIIHGFSFLYLNKNFTGYFFKEIFFRIFSATAQKLREYFRIHMNKT